MDHLAGLVYKKDDRTFVPTDITYQARPHSGGYSQSMTLMKNGKQLLHIVPVPYERNKSKLLYAVYDLKKLLRKYLWNMLSNIYSL